MNVSTLLSTATSQAGSSQQTRQAEQPPAPEAKQATPDNDETFIDKAYRSLVLNRMGVDTEQLEEIEQKIEELESKSSLTKDEKDKLESLMKARDQLFEEAMRRQAEEGNSSQPSVNRNGIPTEIANKYDPRAISPDDMSLLAKDLHEAGVISWEQRSRMSFQFVKTHFYKNHTPESQQVDPSEPMDFVKFWEERVKANEYFNVPADQKARDQGILDVLRRV